MAAERGGSALSNVPLFSFYTHYSRERVALQEASEVTQPRVGLSDQGKHLMLLYLCEDVSRTLDQKDMIFMAQMGRQGPGRSWHSV
jgi:hypothetical protein